MVGFGSLRTWSTKELEPIGGTTAEISSATFGYGIDQPVVVTGGLGGVKVWDAADLVTGLVPTPLEVGKLATSTSGDFILAEAFDTEMALFVIRSSDGEILDRHPLRGGARAIQVVGAGSHGVWIQGDTVTVAPLDDLSHPLWDSREIHRGTINTVASHGDYLSTGEPMDRSASPPGRLERPRPSLGGERCGRGVRDATASGGAAG